MFSRKALFLERKILLWPSQKDPFGCFKAFLVSKSLVLDLKGCFGLVDFDG